MEEKRKYPRYNMDCTALVVFNKSLQKVDIDDISLNGMLFEHVHEVECELNNIVKIHFFDRNSEILCSLTGVIKRIDDNKIAIQFEDKQNKIAEVVKNLSE